MGEGLQNVQRSIMRASTHTIKQYFIAGSLNETAVITRGGAMPDDHIGNTHKNILPQSRDTSPFIRWHTLQSVSARKAMNESGGAIVGGGGVTNANAIANGQNSAYEKLYALIRNA